MKKTIFISLFFICGYITAQGQFGAGYVSTVDTYQYLKNPEIVNGVDYKNSVGSTILNFGIGPKIWMGNAKYTLSLEAQANLGFLAFDLKNYRGLGALSIPIIAKINTRGMSGFALLPFPGISIGGGVQYSLTDLAFVSDQEQSERGDWYRMYIIDVGFGLGMRGRDISMYARYGFGDQQSRAFHLGITLNVNRTMRKKFKSSKKGKDDIQSKPTTD